MVEVRLTPSVFYALPAMRARGRIWWRAAAFFSGFAVITVVAFADGGYFRETWAWTTLALSSLAWIVLLVRDKIVIGRLDLAALAALTAFVGWVALSAAWSPAPDDSLQEGERGSIYVAASLAFVLLVDRDRIREHLAGIAAGATLVAAYSLGERVAGEQPITGDPIQGARLIEPLGYANALGILAALGLLVALGLAAHASSRQGRALWLAPVIVLLPTLVWTESRGTSLALIAGLCVLVLVERTRIAALLPGSPKLSQAIGAVLAVVVVSVVAIAALRADRPLGPRVDYWGVAWSQFEENAWLGSGAGTFARYWEREETPVAVRDAHSLYVETLAELGPAGLVLLLAALGIPILAARVGRNHAMTGTGASAYTAYLVHAGLDWDWEMPAVTLAGLLCGVALLAAGRQRPDEITIGARGRGVFAFAAVAIGGLALAGRLAN
ncbi:MAG: O-antigen ligase family protein [Gaiellaceae bacterium]